MPTRIFLYQRGSVGKCEQPQWVSVNARHGEGGRMMQLGAGLAGAPIGHGLPGKGTISNPRRCMKGKNHESRSACLRASSRY